MHSCTKFRQAFGASFGQSSTSISPTVVFKTTLPDVAGCKTVDIVGLIIWYRAVGQSSSQALSSARCSRQVRREHHEWGRSPEHGVCGDAVSGEPPQPTANLTIVFGTVRVHKKSEDPKQIWTVIRDLYIARLTKLMTVPGKATFFRFSSFSHFPRPPKACFFSP